ncbi:septum formation family protein [Pseudactinotalea suaedae]
MRIAVGAALVASLVACGDGGEDPTPTVSPSTTTGTSEEPRGDGASEVPTSEEPTDEATSPEPDATGTPGLEDVPTAEVGACLNAVDLLGGGGVSEIPTVDCTEEHDAQVFAVIALPDGEYPGDDALATLVLDECGAAFEEFVGVPPAESTLELDGLSPSQDTWAVGDREIICLAFYPDLSTTTESFEGSGL